MTRLPFSLWASPWACVRALGQTGVLGPRPLAALLLLGWMGVRHGLSLYTLAAWWAARQPQGVALNVDGVPISWRALVARADALAALLAGALGPGRSGRVGLYAASSVDWVAALLACGRLGVGVVLLGTLLEPQAAARVAHEQRLSLLLVDGARACGLPPELPQLRLDTAPGTPSRPQWPPAGRSTVTLLTSGTTGTPKSVERRPQPLTLLGTLTALLTELRPQAGSPTLLTLPLANGHGLSTLGLCLLMGAPLHLLTRPTPQSIGATLQQDAIETLVLVPTLLHRLLAQDAPPVAPALRRIICGSAPLPPALAGRALAHFGPVLFNLYGSSEAGLISLASPELLAQAPESVGRVLPGVRLQIADGQGRPLAAGEEGRVRVRGGLTVGQEPLWDTGDRGLLDGQGRLVLRGRQDDLIVCGGENIVPEALEPRLLTLPGVADCGVYALPDDEYGQRPQACVVLADEVRAAGVDPLTALKDLHDLLAQTWPRTLRPQRLSAVPELPRTPLGKVQRRLLPEWAAQGVTVHADEVKLYGASGDG